MTAESKELVETEIRRVMEEQGNAVRARNVEGLVSNCVPDVVSFDVVGGLQRIGSDKSRCPFRKGGATMSTSNTAQSSRLVPPSASIPGPEYRRLDAFVGNWSLDGQQYDGPFGPDAKIVAVESYEWLAGGFFLIHRLGGKLDSNEIACMEIIGFDESSQNYPRYTFYSNGKTNEWQSRETDAGWTVIGDSVMASKPLKVRCTIVFSESGKQMASKWEYSGDGSNWKTFWDVKATKAA